MREMEGCRIGGIKRLLLFCPHHSQAMDEWISSCFLKNIDTENTFSLRIIEMPSTGQNKNVLPKSWFNVSFIWAVQINFFECIYCTFFLS